MNEAVKTPDTRFTAKTCERNARHYNEDSGVRDDARNEDARMRSAPRWCVPDHKGAVRNSSDAERAWRKLVALYRDAL